MIIGNPRKVYLVAQKMPYPTHYSKYYQYAPTPSTVLLVIALCESMTQKSKINKTILANELLELLASVLFQKGLPPLFSWGPSMQLKSSATRKPLVHQHGDLLPKHHLQSIIPTCMDTSQDPRHFINTKNNRNHLLITSMQHIHIDISIFSKL